jgi:uncharacterized Zn-binding protein involved in type VI secretion
MGKPAARIGDMTAHGGAIVMGWPTVLIGGMPAARISDMHVCPMLTPGVPPIPHVGGPVILGSMGVLIGGMPAARMGDMAMCVGPPDMIALGCFTVMIGETMAGAAAAPGPVKVGLSSAAAAQIAAATALSDNKETSTKAEHWVEFEFVDKAGKPVSGVHYKFTDSGGKESKGVLRPDGRICRDALNAGQCKAQLYGVSNAKWSKDKAEVGEKVKLTADVEGFDNGTTALIEIYKRDIKGPDVLFKTIETKVQNNKVEAEWEYVLPQPSKEDLRDKAKEKPYSAPSYYFEVLIDNCKAHSRLLEYKDWIEIKLKDDKGNAVGNKSYRLYLSNGEIRKGKLDGSGHAKENKIPPGPVRIFIDPRK